MITRVVFLALIGLLSTVLISCSEKPSEEQPTEQITTNEVFDTTQTKFGARITELSDIEYPHNPDLGNMSSNYHQLSHDSILLERKADGNFKIVITPKNTKTNTVTFEDVDLRIYIPSLPEWVKKDTFLTNFGYTNAEWNRHQIRYDRPKEYFTIQGDGYEQDKLIRIDIARNCLHSGLWEIIFYSEEDGKSVPCYHGWFMFPMDLYAHLFKEVNDQNFDDYKGRMAEWIDPENESINFDLLRTIRSEKEIAFQNLNDGLYPKTGARKSKWKNIIYPKNPVKIDQFLNDSTRFATFSPPGLYDKGDPRRTWLSKLAKLETLTMRKTVQENLDSEKELTELEFKFTNRSGSVITYLYFGGLDLDTMPTLTLEENNVGYKMPMGIANHHFYETYEKAQNNPVKKNPYYGVLVNGKKKCLDSHAIGIDGPLMFWDAEDKGLMHLYILSFERHAFVGHYTFRPYDDEVEEAGEPQDD